MSSKITLPKGIFITFEGVDGCGKTTAMKSFTEYLNENNFSFIKTREPGGTPISEEIRSLILNNDSEMTDLTEVYLFAASRTEHVRKVITPAIENGQIVISDRYIDSNLAFQDGGRKIPIQTIKDINKHAINGIMPDLTFLLMISIEAAKERRKHSENDRIEKERDDFHKRVADTYYDLAKKEPERIKIINAEQTPIKVASDIIEIADHSLKLKELKLKYDSSQR